MGRGEPVAWVTLALVSGALSWKAWSGGRPEEPAPSPPPALPRPATDAERAAVEALQRSLQAEIRAATTRLGHPPALDELEGPDDQGLPLLTGGVPDNPLAPGVAGVLARCPAVPRADDRVDWVYCPDSGTVQAVGLP